jgi:NAD-dependent SIR2 family protein deacetylase
VTSSGVDAVAGLVRAGELLVLTGAGISTESGIPDYRGPTGAARRGSPMTYQAFVGDADGRRRYWARSFLGWRQIAGAQPNAGHLAVAELQRAGYLSGLITQNVDGLHQAAGATGVIELHGGLDAVRCLECGWASSRFEIDHVLRAANPGFSAEALGVNADGDVDLADDSLADFVAPQCRGCASSLLKPDVVFFGESVPPHRVAQCFELVERSRALLVLGSSLTVFSGFRFARAASRRGIPVAIVNQGPTRADDLADFKLEVPLGTFLTRLAAAVAPAATPLAEPPLAAATSSEMDEARSPVSA